MPQAQIHTGTYSPRFAAWFGTYVRWRAKRCFHAVRLAHPEVLADSKNDPRPLVVVMNHPGWWDPLTASIVHHALLAPRPGMAPMDQSQLEKFSFFKRLGLFGIDPDDPKMLDAMMAHVRAEWQHDPGTVLWITPQGRFVDVRAPIEARPGAAAVASRTPDVRMVSLAIEYTFWLDQRPEMLLRLAEVEAPSRSTLPRWNRAITQAMEANAAALATLVIARDPAPFRTLLASNAGINPAMNLWLRLRGKRVDIDSPRIAPGADPKAARRAAAQLASNITPNIAANAAPGSSHA